MNKKIALILLIITTICKFEISAIEIYKSDLICTFPYKYFNSDTEYNNLSDTEKIENICFVKDGYKWNWNFAGIIGNKFIFYDFSSLDLKYIAFFDFNGNLEKKLVLPLKSQYGNEYALSIINDSIVINHMNLFNFGKKPTKNFNIWIYDSRGNLKQKFYYKYAALLNFLDKDWNTYSISFFFNKAKFGNLFKEKYTEYTPAYFKYQIFSQNNNTINIFDKTKNDTYNIKIPVELDIVFIGTIYGFDDGNNLYLIIQTDKILNPEQISSWKSHNIVRPTYICKISLKGEIIASFKINSVVGFDGMVTANGNIYQYHKIYINNYNKSTGRAITKWYIEK